MKVQTRNRFIHVSLVTLVISAILFSVMPVTLWASGDEATLPSYSAADAIAEMQEKGISGKDDVWTYTAKRLTNEGNSITPTGTWLTPTLGLGKSDNDNVNAYLPKQMNISGVRNGVSSKDGAVYSFVGSGDGYMGALTFVAPLSGEINLSDIKNIGIGSAGTGNPFWTLHQFGTKIGITIYHNDVKIWPTDQEYHTLNGERWIGGNKVYGNTTVDFPDLGTLRVTRGDKIRIACIPLKLEWGYIKMSPKVDYVSVDEYQPEIIELPVFSSAEEVLKLQEAGVSDENTVWTYTPKKVKMDETDGFYKQTGDWLYPKLELGRSDNEGVNSLLPKQMNVSGTRSGIASDGSKVYTFAGYGDGYSSTLTFISPLSGKIKLTDPSGFGIGSAGTGDPFWTLHNPAEIGVVIYKNDEKIWPLEQDYHLLKGNDWSTNPPTWGNLTVDFPNLGAINVTKGDEIHISVIPLSLAWGYVALSPTVEYTEVDKIQPEIVELPEFSSAEEVLKLQEAGAADENTVWTYTPKRVKMDEEDGLYKQTGEWLYPELELGRSDNEGVNNLLPKQMNIPGTRNGIASDGNKVYTFAGYGGGYSSTLTFVAPLSGKVKLTDPTGIGIGSAGTGDPFWTLHEPREIGVVIYKNDEKIWPVDQDYYLLKGNDWSTDPPTWGELTAYFPKFGTIDVIKGDEIHISVIPLSLAWGYVALAPTVKYTEVDKIQPESSAEYKFKAYSDIEKVLNNDSFEGTNWIVEGMACYPDTNGLNVPDGKWIGLEMKPGRPSSNEIYDTLPDWMMLKSSQLGIAAYNKSVILSTGSSGVDFAIALTFIAPKSGKVDLSDPAGGIFGSAGLAAPFWSLNEATKIAGIAIYKNDEKIWPLEDDYYKLQGQWDHTIGGYNYDNEYEVIFPSIKNIEVNAGDKLRMCVIPVKDTWQYISLSPQVKYTEIDLDSTVTESDGLKTPIASYRAVDIVKKAVEAGVFDDPIWDFNAIEFKESMLVDEPNELSVVFADELPFIFKEMNFNATPFDVKCFTVPLTDMSIAVDKNDRLLLRPQCGSYYSAVAFKAPKTGIIRLHSNDLNPGFAAYHQWVPYYTLQDTFDPDYGKKIQLYVYKNSTQIWPTNANQPNTLTNECRTVPFPDMELQVYEGDEIRFLITSDNSWQFCNFDPVIDYLKYNNEIRPENDKPGWNIGRNADDIVWEDFETEEEILEQEILEEVKENTPIENAEIQNEDNISDKDENEETTKKVAKKIIKRRYFKRNYTGIIVLIVSISVVVILSVTGGILFYRKKKKLLKK